MGNNQVLVGAINESLLSLGKPIMKTIIWYLNARGLYLDENRDVDIREFNHHLEAIIGDISKVVLDEIYDNLKDGIPSPPVLDIKAPTIEKIDQLMQLYSGGTATP